MCRFTQEEQMYLQEILEVAIGLVFMWLVVSIAAMTMQEWLSNVLNSRAKELERTISEMLNSKRLARQLYDHPLIASLYRPSRNPKKKARLPSYLPADKFASALVEIIISAGIDTSPLKGMTAQIDAHLADSLESQEQLKQALNEWQAILMTAKQVASTGVGQAAVDTLKLQIDAFGRKYPEIQPTLEELLPPAYAFYQDFFDEERTLAPAGTDVDQSMRQFRLGLKMIGTYNARLKASLTALMREAKVNLLEGEQAAAKMREQIQGWFNDSMERLSGAYKRKAQFLSFMIGLILALLLNVDSINAATTLWREPTLRQAIIAQARDYAATQQAVASTNPDSSVLTPLLTIPELERQLQALNFPFGWISQPVEFTEGVKCDLNSASAYDLAGQPTRLLGLHVGKVCVPVINALPVNLDSLAGWLTKAIGLLITAAGAAQGAPFWFDILKKFINVRGTGEKPAGTTAVG
jgi:hypothetical protein